jgi:hypothetical protein
MGCGGSVDLSGATPLAPPPKLVPNHKAVALFRLGILDGARYAITDAALTPLVPRSTETHEGVVGIRAVELHALPSASTPQAACWVVRGTDDGHVEFVYAAHANADKDADGWVLAGVASAGRCALVSPDLRESTLDDGCMSLGDGSIVTFRWQLCTSALAAFDDEFALCLVPARTQASAANQPDMDGDAPLSTRVSFRDSSVDGGCEPQPAAARPTAASELVPEEPCVVVLRSSVSAVAVLSSLRLADLSNTGADHTIRLVASDELQPLRAQPAAPSHPAELLHHAQWLTATGSDTLPPVATEAVALSWVPRTEDTYAPGELASGAPSPSPSARAYRYLAASGAAPLPAGCCITRRSLAASSPWRVQHCLALASSCCSHTRPTQRRLKRLHPWHGG